MLVVSQADHESAYPVLPTDTKITETVEKYSWYFPIDTNSIVRLGSSIVIRVKWFTTGPLYLYHVILPGMLMCIKNNYGITDNRYNKYDC